ncbi:MAG: hypothetical protein U0974_01850 [Gemmatimonadales bacterium]|nr:hypothetical protein [Gemmatimonadales bacterium]
MLLPDDAHDLGLELSAAARACDYGADVPSPADGRPFGVVLTRQGIRMQLPLLKERMPATVVSRPRTQALWRDVLTAECTIDPDCRVGDLLALFDELPEELVAALKFRLVPQRHHEHFHAIVAEAVAATHATPTGDEAEWTFVIEPTADEVDGAYRVAYDASAFGPPEFAHPGEPYVPEGERMAYASDFMDLDKIARMPVQYDPALTLPCAHEDERAFLRGPLLEWNEGGEVGPRPELPVAARFPVTITLETLLRTMWADLPGPASSLGED